MQNHQYSSEPFARRARMSSREIMLAVAVTLAAAVFVLAASLNRAPETALVNSDNQASHPE